jgi:hypothetical protein
VLTAFAVSAPTWAVAQDGEKKDMPELTCKKLTIVDAAGKPRIVLTFDDAGGQIKLLNASDKNVAALMVDKFGGAFQLSGNDEKRMAVIAANKDGGQLVICDPAGNARTFLGLDGAKEGFLSLRNKADKNTLYAGADDDGGLLRIYAHDGKERAYIGVGAKQGDGLIMLYGTDGKRRHWIGSDKDSTSHTIHFEDGVVQQELRASKTGGYHAMFSKDGKNIIAHIGASNDSGDGLIRLNTPNGKTHSYLGSNKNGTGGLLFLNNPNDSTRVVLGIDANGVGFGEGRDGDNVVRRAMK